MQKVFGNSNCQNLIPYNFCPIYQNELIDFVDVALINLGFDNNALQLKATIVIFEGTNDANNYELDF